MSDTHPQGKDLYDAVLLAERYALPYPLLEEVFRPAPERPLPNTAVTLEDIAAYGSVGWEWRHFAAEYPQLASSEQEYVERLLAALAPTFDGREV
ncbi:hypothetical protein ACGFYU_12615 [Streptomyces sp. NPDC048337]|uniref:hypothetical protein n=1 Tax=Streptomyces sp. NPDC048337 TaxID=3365535 RepID=UPI00371BBC22